MKFSEYQAKVLLENTVSTKLIKNAIDLMNDFINYSVTDLSSDEKKQVIDNMNASIDGTIGNTVSIIGTSEFVKDGKYNKQVNMSIELKFEGISDVTEGGEDTTDVTANDAETDVATEEVPVEEK